MTTLTATPMMLTATIPNRVTSFGDVSHVSLVSRCSDVRVIARFYVLWVVLSYRWFLDKYKANVVGFVMRHVSDLTLRSGSCATRPL